MTPNWEAENGCKGGPRLHGHRADAALGDPRAVDGAVRARLADAGHQTRHAGDDVDWAAFFVRRADPAGRDRAARLPRQPRRAPAGGRRPALADELGARHPLAALSVAFRGADPRLDQRLMARHAGVL